MATSPIISQSGESRTQAAITRVTQSSRALRQLRHKRRGVLSMRHSHGAVNWLKHRTRASFSTTAFHLPFLGGESLLHTAFLRSAPHPLSSAFSAHRAALLQNAKTPVSKLTQRGCARMCTLCPFCLAVVSLKAKSDSSLRIPPSHQRHSG